LIPFDSWQVTNTHRSDIRSWTIALAIFTGSFISTICWKDAMRPSESYMEKSTAALRPELSD
jgi:hypothetical protein